MAEYKKNKDNKPEVGLFVLILIIVLLLIFSNGVPEREREAKERLRERENTLKTIVQNIDEAQEFKKALIHDIRQTTIVLRWVVFGIMTLLNISLFFVLGYHLELKSVLECIAIVNPAIFTIVYIIFFLRYGKFVEIKTAYSELQIFILKLRYDKTEDQLETYLTMQIESKEIILKEIAEIELEITAMEESKNEFAQNFDTQDRSDNNDDIQKNS
jgi:hypothetical protein